MLEYGFEMHPYFKEMPKIGNELKKELKKNMDEIKAGEEILAQEVERVKNYGKSTEVMNKKGEWTTWQRLDYLIDPDTWCPLHTLYDPLDTEEGNTGVVDGLGKIAGKWCAVIAFNNRIMAGAWLPGQSENIIRLLDMTKMLHIPLVWIVNCSGVKLSEQEKLTMNRRGNGYTFYGHSEIMQLGIPIICGIYGTNPAGGGYQGISCSSLIAHKDSNIAVGGGGIVGGMNPKGYFDEEAAEQLIEATRKYKEIPPGRVEIHYNGTGFMREVCATEEGVLDTIKKYIQGMPSYFPDFFRVAEPAEPKFPSTDLYSLVPFNQKRPYDMLEVMARLFDNSEHLEFQPDYGPEIFCTLAKVDGYLCGFVANRSGVLRQGYPEYSDTQGVGGKLYREGLIKLNDFVTVCGRDEIPMIWVQDTTGIQVGDPAEKAELLGLGMSLMYSIEKTNLAMMTIVLRKGSGATHYILGGPPAKSNNAFTLGTATTEIYVMHGETAAAASYSRRLVKEKDAGRPLEPVIDKMNDMMQDYYNKSRPAYCAKTGMVDECVNFTDLRKYCKAFVGAVYQNPVATCPPHLMLTPRRIKK